MKINLKGTRVLQDTIEANTRFVINQGGTRSSKTYSICQYLLLYCLQNSNKVITIVRKTLPALKGTALRDIKEVFSNNNYWNEEQFNKSELQYTDANNNLIEFISVDNPQKIKGRKRNVLWCNEANELMLEDFNQLDIRTEDKVLIDINPSDQFSWIYDLIEAPKTAHKCTLIKSTWRDNTFLSKDIIDSIQSREDDIEWYTVYGLGERSVSKEVIYPNYELKVFPATENYCYGLDFGYNHPTALIRVCQDERKLYFKEEIYQSYLTTADLISLMESKGVDKNKIIYCDYARPEIIADLKKAGYNARNADKNVKAGIDYVKSNKIHIDPSSNNIKREISSYKWKMHSNGFVIDEPVKMLDDAMDAMRYGAFSSKKKTSDISISFI